MCLKVGLLIIDIVECFCIFILRFFFIFIIWICLFYVEYCVFYKFFFREKIVLIMFECMKKFLNLKVIFDCIEIYIFKNY